MTKVGGLTNKYYKETKGLKVSGGQVVKAGAMITREGHKWQPGVNVVGKMHLTATVEGEVYFTKKKGSYKRMITIVNVRPSEVAATK
ncbi:50S ribosomal protein L27 [Candidatus Omnitrophota bacterium]